MAYKALKYEFVEVALPAGPGGAAQTGVKWSFPDLPKLRYTSLQGLTIYTPNAITVSPTGVAPATVAIIKTAYLVLYANERQDLYRIPLIELNRIQASTDPFIRQFYEFAGQKVTWDKCYVELGSQPGNTTDLSFCFGVYYA